MPIERNSLEECAASATPAEAAFELLDEWLRIDNEHTDPGYLLPSRAAVVRFCENHAPVVVVAANAVLWAPVLTALARG